MFGSDWLANLFLMVFFFGLIFTAASLLLGFSHFGGVGGGHGAGHGVGHGGAAGHAGTAGGHTGHMDGGGHHLHVNIDEVHTHLELPDHDGPGFFNMPTIMAFLTWFGGVGYILRHSWNLNGAFVTVFAVLSGLAGASIMFVLLARWLWPMMSTPLRSSDFSLPGTPARVVSPIREGGVGEIVYTKQGTRFTAGARSADDSALARGTEVVILRYERGLAYVQDVHALLSKQESPAGKESGILS